jgi:GxxExxY protein
MIDKDIFVLCDAIRETAFSLHRYLRHGHLEKVYANGLAHRLRKAGFCVEVQRPLLVHDDDGTVLGEYFADMIVNDCLVVELKTCKSLADEHVAQLLGYLRACRVEHGLLINFGAPRFQIRKLVLSDSSAE